MKSYTILLSIVSLIALVSLAAADPATECRQLTELDIAKVNRLQLGKLYHENLALGTNTTGTTAGNPLGSGTTPAKLIDGDRCCSNADNTTDGFKCGVAFNQTDTEFIYVQINLNKTAFVNEFLTAWYLPCRNEPRPFYTLQYFDHGNGVWTDLYTRVLKANSIIKEEPKPCYVIPGDKGDVSLCIDFIDYPALASDMYRIKFNNSQAATQLPASFTDGGWIYEMEVHGVYSDLPWELQNNGLSTTTFQSDLNVTLPQVDVFTANIKQQRLYGLDTQTTSASVKLFTYPGNVDVTNTLFKGTTTVPITNGVANFTNLIIERPPAGQYNLSFSSTPPVPTSVLFTVIPGLPYELKVESGAVTTQKSDVNGAIGSITVSVRDPGNNLVTSTNTSYIDPNMSVKLSNASFAASFTGTKYVAISNTTGTAVFSDLKFARPPTGDYVLEFGVAGVTINITSTAKITPGNAEKLVVVSGGVTGPHPSKVSTLLSTVGLEARDPGNNLTPLAAGSTVTVTLDAQNTTYALAGTTSVNVASNGTITFANIQIVRPIKGTYKLMYAMNGVTGTFSIATVSIGPATDLRVVDTVHSYPSDYVNKLNNIVVKAHDAGGNEVGNTDSVERVITVAILNTTQVLNGTLVSNMTQGSVTFNALSLLSPPVANAYVLKFTTPGLGYSTENVQITIGTGKFLKPVQTEIVRGSIESVSLGSISVRVLDAGLTFTSTADTGNRATAAALTTNPGLLTGTTPQNTANGLVTFADLAMTAPVAGNYTLQFSSANLKNGFVNIVIHPGIARRYNVKPGNMYSFKSNETVPLGAVTIRAHDASNTFVGTYQMSESGALNVTVKLNTAGTTLSGTKGPKYFTNGEVAFNDLSVSSPPIGIYLLEFYSASYVSAMLNVTITVGAPKKLKVVDPTTLISGPSAVTTTLPGIVVWALDAGNTFVGSSDSATRAVTVTCATATVSGQTNANMMNGSVTFNTTTLSSPIVTTHQLKFSSGNLAPAMVAVQVTSGQIHSLQVANQGATSYQSVYATSLATMRVTAHDAGGNFTTNDQTQQVTLVLRNAMGMDVTSKYLTGGAAQNLGGGQVLFSNLKLTSPPKGEYILTFDTSATQPVSTNITVVLGPVVKLGTADVTHNYQSVANTSVSNIKIQVRDAGDNHDASVNNATITVAIVNGTQQIQGTLVRVTNNGEANFGDLSLLNPAVGSYTLRFTSPGLVNFLVNVKIAIGPVTKLVVTSPSSYTNQTSETVVLGTITVRGQDAGSNLVGATDTQQRLVNASISAPGVFTLSTLQGTMTNGVVVFNNLRLHRPQAIVYTLSFATNGLAAANFPINIGRGVPVYLEVESNANPAILNSAPTVNLGAIVIRTMDAGQNFTTTAPLGSATIAAQANDTNARLGGNPVALNLGKSAFNALTLTNPLVGNYRVTFYPMDLGLFNVSVNFRVNPGAGSQLSVFGWQPTTYPSTYHTPIQAITIRVLDSAGNFRGSFDSQTRTVSVSGPAYMNGTMTRNTTNGQVMFTDLGFVKSTVGTPTLTFSSPGLSNAQQQVQTVIGPAAIISISSPASITVGSAQYTMTPNVVVTIRDAGNTPVMGTDVANNGRVITAAIETVTPAVTASGTTCSTVNGTCTLSNLVFNSPPTNPYTITFRDLAMNKLVPGNLNMNVQRGKPFALVPHGYSLQTLPSVVSFQWDPITIRTNNAGGNFTDDPTPVEVEAYIIPGNDLISATLVGTTKVTTVNGVATFNNLRLNSPKSGTYKIGFRGFAMQNTSVNAVVSIGAVWNLVVSSFASNVAKQSDYTTLMEPITIQAVNAGGDHVGAADTNNSRIVYVELLNKTLAGISGTLNTNLNASTALFNNIKLHNASAAVLTLRFWSTDIRPSGQPVYVDVKVTMSIGDVRGLVVFSGGNQQKSCENTFQLSNIQVRTVDAGDNYVTTEDSSTVSVTLVNNVAAVSGNNTEIINAGVANFGQVLLNSPITSPIASGPHVLRFSMYDNNLNAQLSVETAITIIPGTSSRLKITNVGGTANGQDSLGGNYATTVTYLGKGVEGFQRVLLPNVEVRAYDNCHAAQTTATFQVTLVDLDNALVPAGGLGAAFTKAAPVPTVTMTNGVATFSNVYITPRVGTYRLQVNAANQKASVLTVTVKPGPIGPNIGGLVFVDEYAQPGFTVVTNNQGPLAPPPTVQITDDVGNPLNVTLPIRCDLTPQPINLENNQRRTDGGKVKFTDMTVQGAHGASYAMSCATVAFGAGNELTAPVFNGLSVTACTDPSELGPNSVPDEVGGGLVCKCEPGYFQVPGANNKFTCSECGEGTFKDKIGNEPCRKCPQNMNTGGLKASSSVDACICKPGYFNNATNPLCELCTEGGLCQSGKPIAPKPGFFRFREGSSIFFACPNEDACIGGQNATCRTGYTGALCSVCAEGYGKFGVTCTPCGATETSWVLVILAIMLVCLMLSFLVKTASVERSKNATILKILLNYLQVIAFVGDLSVRWPRAIVEMFQMMRLSLFSLNLHPVDCSIGPTYYERFITYMVFPFLAFIGPFVWFCIYYLYRRYIRPPITDAWKSRRKSAQTYGQGEEEKPWLMTPENIKELQRQCKTQYGLTVLISTFLAHPIITKNSFQMFNCVDFDGFKFVAEDLSVSCDTAEHQFWTAMAVIMVCVYCTGVPILAVVLLYRNRHQLHTKKVQDRYRFLYDGYKTTRFYWEAVVMIRKVLIVMVIVFYREKPLTQLYSSLWVIFAALIAHLFARPFATHLTSRLEMFSLITTVVTLMTGLLYYSDELQPSEEEGVNGFLITLNVVMLLTFIGLLLHGFFKAASQAREVLKKQDQISDLLSKVTDDGKSGEQLEMKSMEKEDEPKKKKKKAEAEMSVFDTALPSTADDEDQTTKKKKKKKKAALAAQEEEAAAIAAEEEGAKKKKKKKRLDDDVEPVMEPVKEPEPEPEPEPMVQAEPEPEPEPVSSGMVDLEVPDFDLAPPPVEEEPAPSTDAGDDEEDDGLKKKKKKKKKKKNLDEDF